MFIIKTVKETVSLTKEQLLQSLIQKVTEKERADHEILAKTMADYLELNGSLKNTTILSLITIAFSAGYFYRVFREKNSVTVELPNATVNCVESNSNTSGS